MDADEISNRFELVVQEQEDALGLLKQALAHIDSSEPEPRTLVILCNNLVVGLAARSEEAIREIFLEQVKIYEDCDLTFFDFRTEFRKTSYEAAITSLRQRVDWKDRANSFTDIRAKILELSKLLEGNGDFKLSRPFIVDNQSNMNSEQLTTIAKRFGISGIWAQIAHSEALADHIGVETHSRLEGLVIQKWNQLFEERNRVVHRVSEANGWGIDRINDYADFVTIVVREIGELIKSDCASWFEQAEARAR